MKICNLFFPLQNSYTNDQYHELTDSENLTYEIRSENSIFFEVLISIIIILASELFFILIVFVVVSV